MDNIKRDHVIAGIIGGVSTVFIGLLIKKLVKKGHCGKGGPPPPIVSAVKSEKISKSLGPFSAGKLISYKRGPQWLFTSGTIGID